MPNIDYSTLQANLARISPAPRPKTTAPSVDAIRRALHRESQIDFAPDEEPQAPQGDERIQEHDEANERYLKYIRERNAPPLAQG